MILYSLFAYSQESDVALQSLRKDALNVYMDASDFLKKEIPYINYVRDIKDADVYIISTYQWTGSGGTEYTYFLNGQQLCAGMKDTVSFTAFPDDTYEMIRMKEANTLKMALMRYVMKTPLSRYVNISFSEPLSETVSSDKWNSWVFSASLNGYLNGEKSYNSKNFYGNISANRVTEEWKINLNAGFSYGVDKFLIDDEDYISENNSKSVDALIVKSITDHWSYGGSFNAEASSYNNTEFQAGILPGIEYDIFPYSESTRRQLRILYSAGFNSVRYIDTTIYNKTKENLWLHSLSAAYEVVQKWGTIDISMRYSNYLHDWSKNNFSVDGSVNLRIAKGLSINFGGEVFLIHDQLGLVKEGASTEEVLLRRKELETQYRYFVMFGFTYTFGSIYNNVVNPRFGNSGGSGMTIIF